jgi:hypothetical protein
MDKEIPANQNETPWPVNKVGRKVKVAEKDMARKRVMPTTGSRIGRMPCHPWRHEPLAAD